MKIPKRTKRAAVLGCGPAGLFAAHALIEKGYDVRIFSKKRRSEMFGAQYLHRPIPGLKTSEEVSIDVRLLGTWEGSTRKVYGQGAVPKMTWNEYRAERTSAWDIRVSYYDAWDRYQGLIEDTIIQDLGIWAAWHKRDYGKIVSSLPLNGLCDKQFHQFRTQSIWMVGDAPERGVFCPIPCPPFTVINNGVSDVGWYRVSNMFGYTTAEWPLDRRPPLENLVPVENPLDTTCDCFPGVIRVGRYGAWTRGVLSDAAYYDLAG
jgi:hypothetical protein